MDRCLIARNSLIFFVASAAFRGSTRPNDVPDLLPLTTHADPNVREGLAEILGLIGDPRAVPALRDMTRDSSGQVAALASQALQRIARRQAS